MKLKNLLLLVLLGCAQFASAQQYEVIDAGTVTNVAATSTNSTVNTIIPVTKWGEIGLLCKAELVGSGTSGMTFSFSRSLEGTTKDRKSVV